MHALYSSNLRHPMGDVDISRRSPVISPHFVLAILGWVDLDAGTNLLLAIRGCVDLGPIFC